MDYSPSSIAVFTSDNDMISYNQAKKHRLYYGNYDNLIVESKESPANTYVVNKEDGEQENVSRIITQGLKVLRIDDTDAKS